MAADIHASRLDLFHLSTNPPVSELTFTPCIWQAEEGRSKILTLSYDAMARVVAQREQCTIFDGYSLVNWGRPD